MSKLTWGEAGKRFFRTGISKGVLYPKAQSGVPWNGLISIEEKPSGGKALPYYIDGEKYLNRSEREEFLATLNAFTYPDEFEECDGTASFGNGLYLEQQPRKPFDLSYVSNIGNDLEGLSYGYRIHLLYNVMAAPSSKSNATTTSTMVANAFGWELTTTPVNIPGFAPTSHLIIDSKTTNEYTLRDLEDILYGTDNETPRMPTINELVEIFALIPARILSNFVDGISPLEVTTINPDLKGSFEEGLFTITPESRLRSTAIEGLYRLEE